MVEITEKLRDFLKSETKNTFEVYKDQGRLVVTSESQHSSQNLVPAERIDPRGAVEQSEESDEIMQISESKKADIMDLMELKKALQ